MMAICLVEEDGDREVKNKTSRNHNAMLFDDCYPKCFP